MKTENRNPTTHTPCRYLDPFCRYRRCS